MNQAQDQAQKEQVGGEGGVGEKERRRGREEDSRRGREEEEERRGREEESEEERMRVGEEERERVREKGRKSGDVQYCSVAYYSTSEAPVCLVDPPS